MAYENWRVRLDMPIVGYDRFRRTAAASWGADETGKPYTVTGSVASNFSVDGARAVQLLTVGAWNASIIALPVDANEVTATFALNVVPAGADINLWIALGTDQGNYYALKPNVTPAGDVNLVIEKAAGGFYSAASSSTPKILTGYTAGAKISVHLRRTNTGLIYARLWLASRAEPMNWQLFADDDAVGNFTTAMFMSRAETGNTNTNPAVYWYAQQVTADRRMVDITPYVDTSNSPMGLTIGNTAETDGEPSNASITLQNADQRFTPGNNRSPYWPNVKSARRVEIDETIGYQTFDLYTGQITFPEIESWTESTAAAPRDQQITVSLSDTRAWLDRQPTFVSTLAAHILAADRGSLVDYWPMNGPTSPLPNLVRPNVGLVSKPSLVNNVPTDLPPTFQGQVVAPGDDLFTAQVGLMTNWFAAPNVGPILIGSNDVLTVAMWYQFNFDRAASLIRILGVAGAFFLLTVDADPIAIACNSTSFSTSINGPSTPAGSPVFLMYRVRRNPGLSELWLNGTVYPGTTSGTETLPVAYGVLDSLGVGRAVGGSTTDLGLAHVQVYIGPEEVSPTYADYLAQYEVGILGLEGQTTGQRITTIAGYAGIPATDLAAIDPGVSVMQKAALAGVGPSAAIAEAVETEQGHIGTRGDGRIEFADRRRIYNI